MKLARSRWCWRFVRNCGQRYAETAPNIQQPQNSRPARAPFLARRSTMTLRQRGHLGRARVSGQQPGVRRRRPCRPWRWPCRAHPSPRWFFCLLLLPRWTSPCPTRRDCRVAWCLVAGPGALPDHEPGQGGHRARPEVAPPPVLRDALAGHCARRRPCTEAEVNVEVAGALEA